MDNHNALEQAWLNGYKQGRQAVEKCGPIDVAVGVVRCKDCRHFGGVIYAYTCRFHSSKNTRIQTGEDDFCSYGERKNDGKQTTD